MSSERRTGSLIRLASRHRNSVATAVRKPRASPSSLRVRIRFRPIAVVTKAARKRSDAAAGGGAAKAKRRKRSAGAASSSSSSSSTETTIANWIGACRADARLPGWSFEAHTTPSGAIIKTLIDQHGVKYRSMRAAYASIAAAEAVAAEAKARKAVPRVLDVRELLAKVKPDGCMVCGYDNDHDGMLLCDRCNLEYHMKCLRPPLDAVPEGEWLCPCCAAHADACTVCGTSGDDASTLLCDNCDKEYHMHCLTPPLLRVPEGQWCCPRCERIKNALVDDHAAKMYFRYLSKAGKKSGGGGGVASASASSATASAPPTAAALAHKYAAIDNRTRSRWRAKALVDLAKITEAAVADRLARAPRPIVCARRGAEVVGLRTMLWWADDNAWYEGRVVGYSKPDRLHRIAYDDETSEWVDFELNHHAIGGRLVWAKKDRGRKWFPAQEYIFHGLFDHSHTAKAGTAVETAAEQTMVYVKTFSRKNKQSEWTPIASVKGVDEGDARFFAEELRTELLIRARNAQRAEVDAAYRIRKAVLSHSMVRCWGLLSQVFDADLSIETSIAISNGDHTERSCALVVAVDSAAVKATTKFVKPIAANTTPSDWLSTDYRAEWFQSAVDYPDGAWCVFRALKYNRTTAKHFIIFERRDHKLLHPSWVKLPTWLPCDGMRRTHISKLPHPPRTSSSAASAASIVRGRSNRMLARKAQSAALGNGGRTAAPLHALSTSSAKPESVEGTAASDGESAEEDTPPRRCTNCNLEERCFDLSGGTCRIPSFDTCLQCDKCMRCFHGPCMDPPQQTGTMINEDTWRCRNCEQCKGCGIEFSSLMELLENGGATEAVQTGEFSYGRAIIAALSEPQCDGSIKRKCYETARTTKDVLRLLEIERIDLSATDRNGCNALWWACTKCIEPLALQLLAMGGVDVNARHKRNGITPLWLACRKSLSTVALRLLDAEGIDVNAMDKSGKTSPLWQACEKRLDAVALRILAIGGADVNAMNSKTGTTILDIASHGSARGSVLVQQLRANGALHYYQVEAFRAVKQVTTAASSAVAAEFEAAYAEERPVTAAAVSSAIMLSAATAPISPPGSGDASQVETLARSDDNSGGADGPSVDAIDWTKVWVRKGRRGGSVAYCMCCRPKCDRGEVCSMCLTCWGEPVVPIDDSHGGVPAGGFPYAQAMSRSLSLPIPWPERWFTPKIVNFFCGECRVCCSRKRVCGQCQGCLKDACGACAACTSQPQRLPCTARICVDVPQCLKFAGRRKRLGTSEERGLARSNLVAAVEPGVGPPQLQDCGLKQARAMGQINAMRRSSAVLSSCFDELDNEASDPAPDDKWVQCGFCDAWTHARCLGLSAATYDALQTAAHPVFGGGESFMCPHCVEERIVRIINLLVHKDRKAYFFSPVTDAIAKGYSDLIADPMCFEFIRYGVEDGGYSSSVRGAQLLRRDLALLVLNAIRFNEVGSFVGQVAVGILNSAVELIETWLPRTTPSDVEQRARRLIKTDGRQKELEAKRRAERKQEKLDEHQAVSVELNDLVKPAGPYSFVTINPAVMTLTCSTAAALSAVEACLLCGRTGDGDALIFCYDCGEAFHSFCVMPNRDASFVERAKLLWRCHNCTSCAGCGVRSHDDLLVSCDACDTAFHTCCVQPILPKVPDGKWFCGACVECKTCTTIQPPRRWSAKVDVCRSCDVVGKDLCVSCSIVVHASERSVECAVCASKMHEQCHLPTAESAKVCNQCRMLCAELNSITRDVQRMAGIDTGDESILLANGESYTDPHCTPFPVATTASTAAMGKSPPSMTSAVAAVPLAVASAADPTVFTMPHRTKMDKHGKVWNAGTWSIDEVARFTQAFEKYGSDYTQLSAAVGTRSKSQCGSKIKSTQRSRENIADSGRRSRELREMRAEDQPRHRSRVVAAKPHTPRYAKKRQRTVVSSCGTASTQALAQAASSMPSLNDRWRARDGFLCWTWGGSARLRVHNTSLQHSEAANLAAVKRATSAALDDRECVLCAKRGDCTVAGSLIPVAFDVWVHTDCALWSPSVSVSGSAMHGVTKGAQLAATKVCTRCAQPKASILCSNKVYCGHVYHYACARESGGAMRFEEGSNGIARRTFLCPAHAAPAPAPTQDVQEAAAKPELVVPLLPVAVSFQSLPIARIITRSSSSSSSGSSSPMESEHVPLRVPGQRKPRWVEIDELEHDMKAQLTVSEIIGREAAARSATRGACIRIGALSVHSLGVPASDPMDCRWFTTEECIIPIGFIATRMYWDWARPNTRCMYELAVANIATLPAELRSRVIDRAAAESAASATAAERGSFLALRGPLFVIKRRGGGTSHDSTSAILSATPLGALHELWRRIDACSEPCFERIRAMNRSLGLVCLDRGRKMEGREWRQPRSQTYGMVPSHFFGYGLAKVAAAIEMMPGIALLALPWRVFDDAHSAPRGAPWRRAPYRCQWQLPTPTAVDEALQRLRLHQLGQLAANTSGCARAEGYILGDEMRRRQHVAALRILNRHDSAKGATKPKKRRSTIEREVPLVGDDVDAAAGATGWAGGEADPKMDPKTDYVTMYRVLKSTPVSSRFEVRRSQIHGWGLFLRADFPGGFIEKNGMVIEYVGEIIRHLVADERERAYLAAGDEAAGGGCYMFRIDAEGIVDATWRGNEARFMNHCCEPNAYSRVVSTELGGAKRIIIFAAQRLNAGDEVLYDYNFQFEEGDEEGIECKCGAPSCRGLMN